MHVVVLGAGVIGVTTAYYLSRAGYEVTVIDRASHPASGTSHANGGQLSYSFTEALANPAFIARIPGVLRGADPAVRITRLFDMAFAGWGARFLRQCTNYRAQQNTLTMLRLALRSAVLLGELRAEVPIEFAFRKAGKLVLMREQRDLHEAAKSSELKRRHGCNTQLLSAEEAIQVEPTIAAMDADYAGAVYSSDDEVGDAREFCTELSRWLVDHTSTKMHFDTEVSGLLTRGRRAVGVKTTADEIAADAVVVCLGAWSPALLRPLGIRAAIYPVRGYSLTLPPGDAAPSVSLTDVKNKFVFSRLNGKIRIAGFADFGGLDDSRDAARVATLLAAARRVAPTAADYDSPSSQPWGGYRPMTPSGVPLTGATRITGLFLNTGHGMLGWTMACASGHDAADLIGRHGQA